MHRVSSSHGRTAMVAILLLAIATAGPSFASESAELRLDRDLFFSDGKGSMQDLSAEPETAIPPILATWDSKGQLAELKIDYPLEGSIFPPEIVPPQFLWHDSSEQAQAWLVVVAFTDVPHRLCVLTGGKRQVRDIDPRCVTDTNVHKETEYQTSAKGWIPSGPVWELMKRLSVEKDATVTILGLSATAVSKEGSPPRLLSQGGVRIKTSKDPVGAPIFYRDVPMMPVPTTEGVIRPLAASAVAMIDWRLRDISKPSAPSVMRDMPTCANCHSFSVNGKTLGMDMDGPSAEGETIDKGAYVVKDIEERMVIEDADVFSWNEFKDRPEGKETMGLFPQVSPDGQAVATTINESIFAVNYPDFRFCQTFYPTRGIIAIYDRKTKEIRRLPGADLEEYVQGNPVWSPDGKTIVFIRAEAKDNYGPGPRPKRANDPEETQVKFDLCRIPYNDGKGGVAEPVPGASNNGMSNSFAKFSPDGKWIVFVQARNALLMRPDSKLYVIPAQGGEAREMRCNTSLMNSWHSWSPNSRWLVFSSKVNTPYTEMFLTHVDEAGTDSPPILIPDSTPFNRAVNIPEFFNNRPESLREIVAPALDYRRRMREGLELVRLGKIEEAIAKLQESHEMKPDYPDALLHLSRALAETGKLDEVVDGYKEFLRKDPESAMAHTNLGVALCMQGKIPEGIPHYQKAAKANPEYPAAFSNWGFALMALGNFGEAAQRFERVLELKPDSEESHLCLGDALARGGHLDKALSHYKQALRINPKSAKAHTHWGVALLSAGQAKESIASFSRALELDPRYVPAHLSWGIALMSLDRAAEAAQRFEAVIETSPQNASARYHLANALIVMGQVDRAIGQYERALQLDPRYPDALSGLADALVMKGKPREAASYYEKAVAADPNNGQIHAGFGRFLAQQGRLDQAVQHFERAAAIDPRSEDAHYLLASALFRQGDVANAVRHLEKTLEINPANQQARNALQQLRSQAPRPR